MNNTTPKPGDEVILTIRGKRTRWKPGANYSPGTFEVMYGEGNTRFLLVNPTNKDLTYEVVKPPLPTKAGTVLYDRTLGYKYVKLDNSLCGKWYIVGADGGISTDYTIKSRWDDGYLEVSSLP